MKTIKIFVWTAIFLLVIVTGIIYLLRNALIHSLAEEILSESLAVPSSIESVDWNLFSGKVDIHNLKINNSEEWGKKNYAINIRKIEIKLNVLSLFGDTIFLDKVLIDTPSVYYLFKDSKSNMKTIINDTKRLSKSEFNSEKRYRLTKNLVASKIKTVNGQVHLKDGKIKKINVEDIYLKSNREILPQAILIVVLEKVLYSVEAVLSPRKPQKIPLKSIKNIL